MRLPYPLLRPLLFRLEAERAHDLSLATLGGLRRLGLSRAAPPALPVTVMGLRFANPVGLAAGLDKNASHVDALASLGFGFLEVGTVTPRPQPGNPRPRLFRLPKSRALINRMGFNNVGVDVFLRNLERSRYRGVLGVNIGKNADTPLARAADDYLECLRRVYARADYVTVNVSSPNTQGLRALQEGEELSALLATLKAEQAVLADRHGKYVPLALKIAPDLDDAQVDLLAATARRQRVDALIATNTTIARPGVAGQRHADQDGGLSGGPLLTPANAVLARLHASLAGEIPLIGVGGILQGRDAVAKIAAGASLVQLYTGLIYRGPKLVRECVTALARDAGVRAKRPAAPR